MLEHWVGIMSYSPSVLSDEEAVKAWLRDYAGELLSVGIRLGLTAEQQTELQNRLVSIRQGFEAISAIKGSFSSDLALHQPKNDPMKLRWLEEH
jgi:hypothetical protein